MTRILLLTTIFCFSHQLHAQTPYRLHRDRQNGFSFMYPAYWNISYYAEEGGDIAVCEPSTPEEKAKFSECYEGIVFYIEIFNKPLEPILVSRGYQKTGRGFVTYDRVNDSVYTKPIQGTNWQGVYHLNTCGIMCEETGFSAAAGKCEFIYFSRKNKTILISTGGRQLDETVLMRIITTFRFI